MQAVPTSKQETLSLKFCMETGLPTGSTKVNPFTSCKTDIITSHYNAGHTYTVQELVIEVTLKNHSNNGFAILHGIN